MVRIVTSREKEAVADSLKLLELIFEHREDLPVAFELWDGTRWPERGPRPATLVLRTPGSLRAMFEADSEKGLAEAFLSQRFDVTGSLEAACSLVDHLADGGEIGLLKRVRTKALLRKLPLEKSTTCGRFAPIGSSPGTHSLESDREAIEFHYDVSNEFYRLWLDPRMVYSCAYFSRSGQGLASAQKAKLDLLCRKLRLKPGDRLLDVGCGWGGLALYAAEHYGVRVTGITLSRRQAEFAREKVARSRLSDRVRIEMIDYREIPTGQVYDAIVSVGMAEHVGRDHLANYFSVLSDHLKAGGVFMNHAISEAKPRRKTGASFIDAHVFPDGDIPPIPVVLAAAETAGLEVRDVENLREHYCQTLRLWGRRLEDRHEEALAHVDEATWRTWQLYLAASAFAFDRGYLAIYQTLLSKSDANGRSGLPWTRSDWYESRAD